MNSITLTGNICKDLELKSTNSGKNVCSFNLAVKRPFTKDVTDFITIVCWNKQAENVFKYCGKGSKIGVSGMLTTRTYDDSEGNKRTVYEVVANEVEFLMQKTESTFVPHDSNGYSVGGNSISKPTEDFDGFMPIEDDDLPF